MRSTASADAKWQGAHSTRPRHGFIHRVRKGTIQTIQTIHVNVSNTNLIKFTHHHHHQLATVLNLLGYASGERQWRQWAAAEAKLMSTATSPGLAALLLQSQTSGRCFWGLRIKNVPSHVHVKGLDLLGFFRKDVFQKVKELGVLWNSFVKPFSMQCSFVRWSPVRHRQNQTFFLVFFSRRWSMTCSASSTNSKRRTRGEMPGAKRRRKTPRRPRPGDVRWSVEQEKRSGIRIGGSRRAKQTELISWRPRCLPWMQSLLLRLLILHDFAVDDKRGCSFLDFLETTTGDVLQASILKVWHRNRLHMKNGISEFLQCTFEDRICYGSCWFDRQRRDLQHEGLLAHLFWTSPMAEIWNDMPEVLQETLSAAKLQRKKEEEQAAGVIVHWKRGAWQFAEFDRRLGLMSSCTKRTADRRLTCFRALMLTNAANSASSGSESAQGGIGGAEASLWQKPSR